MQYIKPNDRYQYVMMSSMDDSITSDNPVRVIDCIVDEIISANKSRFEKIRETEAGRPKYHSSTLIKLFLYGYLNGISSSRKLEIETHRNKEVIWLLGGLRPDHWTISNYRKENGKEIKEVAKKFRQFLMENGYIKLKTVAIDGSKIRAYANREMLSFDKIQKKVEKIEAEMDQYIKQLARNDERDDVTDEINTEDKTKYVDKIIELQKEIEKLKKQTEILEKEDIKYISSTDTDARLMRSKEGRIPAYNIQIAVDEKHGMIVDSEVVQDETDLRMLPEMVDSIKEELGQIPEEILADKGFYNPDLIERVEKTENIDIYIPEPNKQKGHKSFTYDEENDMYICPKGKKLIVIARNIKARNSIVDVYQCRECEGCPIRNECTTSKKGRIIKRYHNEKWRENYKKRISTSFAKTKISLRREIVEHPFGVIKYLMGLTPLLLRGVRKVSTEIDLYTTVFNLKRLINIELTDIILERVIKFRWKMA